MLSTLKTRWERLLGTVVELSSLFHLAPEREEVLARILEASQQILEGTRAHLVLLGEHAVQFYALDEESRLRLDPLARQMRWVDWIRTQEGARAEDELPDFVRAQLRVATGPALVAPLRTRDRQLGALLVEGVGGEEDLELLTLLANQAAVTLENQRLYQRLELEARTDGLTGVGNYRFFMESLEREIERARRFGESFAVLMVDVDNLKEYNDLYGHLGGSAALKELAQILKEGSRQIDVVAKYGGDEFSLILPNSSWYGASCFARRLLGRAREHRFEGDPERRLTLSVGISMYPDDGEEPRGLLRRADERLYRAKASGRDRIGER